MDTQWFLGGNTAIGFVSHFDTLLTDPRVKELVILKGGPGCGKSTFMKKLRQTAQQLGADTESYLCSSDPDSLDGLLILPIGFAVVDGTAPHVLEPRLCGCDGIYLNLGCFYDTSALKARAPALEVLKQKNQALYPVAYAHLTAASGLRRCDNVCLPATDAAGLSSLMQMLPQEPDQSRTGQGKVRKVFLHTFTPKGELWQTDTIHSLCHTCISLIDPYGISVPLLARMQEKYHLAGYDVITAIDPLSPNQAEAVLIPEAELAYVRSNGPMEGCAVQIQLSRFYTPTASDAVRNQAVMEHCAEAVRLLQKAKTIHDDMEAEYRPCVCFDGLDLLTQEYQKKIKGLILER